MSELKLVVPPTGVVFDLDGLLLDTERMYWKSFDTAALAADLDFPEDFYIELVGGPEARTHALMQERFGPEFSIPEFEQAWREQFHIIVDSGLIAPKAGAIEMLSMLNERDVPIAVATSSHRELVEQTMKAAAIRDYFQHIVCGDEVVNGKPSPDIYLAACDRIQQSPHQCMAFEDTEIGMSAAIAAGLRCVLVPDMKQPTDQGLAKALERFPSLLDAAMWLKRVLDS